MTLRWVPGWNGLTEPEAVSYVAAVEAADGQDLEFGVARAINDFVVGCKNDGIWDAIKACCILAGARTLNGALVPLVGAAPTRFGTESGWNYNRETGLEGNGTDNYLNSNRANNADPQNNAHLACRITTIAPSSASYIGTNQSAGGSSFILRNANFGLILQTRGVSNSIPVVNSHLTAGFKGASRSNSTQMTRRFDGATATVSYNSTATNSNSYFVFASNNGSTAALFADARISFYSIGESLDLAALDTRVSNLMTAIGAAI